MILVNTTSCIRSFFALTLKSELSDLSSGHQKGDMVSQEMGKLILVFETFVDRIHLEFLHLPVAAGNVIRLN